MAKKKFIKQALPASSKGKLHEHLHVAHDKKIPEAKLEKAAHSTNPTIKKEAVLAKTSKGMHHGKKKTPMSEKMYGKKEK